MSFYVACSPETLTMNKYIVFILLLIGTPSVAQNLKLSMKFQRSFDYLYHSANDRYKQNIMQYGHLRTAMPDSANLDDYCTLAGSLWEINRRDDAKEMFLRVMQSDATTIDHPSGTRYDYGSYTSNYKNEAAIYLCKIYIEQYEFDSAFIYLEDAVNKYKVSYGCGTGYARQQDEYSFLYASIYLGQKKYNKVLNLLMPKCLDRNDQVVVKAIRKLYTEEQIKQELAKAVKTMKFVFGDEPSYIYQESDLNHLDTIRYYSGIAYVKMFNKEVTIHSPLPDKDGDRITKEQLIEEFTESSFYRSLHKE